MEKKRWSPRLKNFFHALKTNIQIKSPVLSLSDAVFIMLINVQMPTIFNISKQDKCRAELS